MLNNPDYFITDIVFPYGADAWTVRVSFKNRKNGKKTENLYEAREDYFRVQQQSTKQIAAREFVKCSYEPKPKRAEAKPIIGKPQKKGKAKKA